MRFSVDRWVEKRSSIPWPVSGLILNALSWSFNNGKWRVHLVHQGGIQCRAPQRGQ
jgi:hypothetical protein